MKQFGTVEKLSIVAITAAALTAMAVLIRVPPGPDRSLHRAIGLTLARQALDLGQPRAQIIVITRDTEAFPQPALEILLRSFEKEIRRGGASAALVRRLQVDPLRPLEVPAGDFVQLLRRAQPGEVIVSLLGPPLLSEEQWSRARPLKARIVAFCPGAVAENVDVPRLIEAGFLHAAVVSRSFPAEARAGNVPKPAGFDELYTTLTATGRAPGARAGSSL